MGIRVLSSRDFRGVVYDSVTDRPLPLPIFHGEDEANHFILWAQREDREPFGDHRSAHYDLLALNDSYNEWLEKCCNEYGELTEESARELEES